MYDIALDEAYRKSATGIELRTPEEVQKYKDNNNIHTKFPYVWNVWASAVAESGPDGYQFYVWAVYTHRPKEISMKPITYVCRKEADVFPMDGYNDDGLFYKRVPCGDKRTIQTDYENQTPIWWEYGDVKQVMTVWSSDPNFLPEFGYITSEVLPAGFTDETYFSQPYGCEMFLSTAVRYPLVAIRQHQIVNYGSKSRVEVWRYDTTQSADSAEPYCAITINAFNITNGGIVSPHESTAPPAKNPRAQIASGSLNSLEMWQDAPVVRHTLSLTKHGSVRYPYTVGNWQYYYITDSKYINKKILFDDNIGDQWIIHKDNFYKDQYEMPTMIDPEEIDLSNVKCPRSKLLDICHTRSKYLKVYSESQVISDSLEGASQYIKSQMRTIPNLVNGSFYDNGVLIAVGSNGTILRSTNEGATFVPIYTNTNDDLSNVIHVTYQDGPYASLGLWIAVGNEGTVLYSYDNGLSWVKQSLGTVGPLVAICKNPNTDDIVIVEDDINTTFFFNDEPGNFSRFERVTYTDPNTSTQYSIFDIACSDSGTWIAVGRRGQVLRSTNRYNWEKISIQIDNELHAVHYHNGVWMIGGSGYVCYRSTDDGLSWTKIQDIEFNEDGEYSIFDFCIDNNNWIAVGGDMANDLGNIWRSIDNGLSWKLIDQISKDSYYFTAARFINVVRLATTFITYSDMRIIQSPDGIAWNITMNYDFIYSNDIYYSNGVWISVGGWNRIMRSDDNCLSWKNAKLFESYYSNTKCKYGNGVWIVIGQPKINLRSTDNGLTWASVAIPTSLNDIHYANGVWLAVYSSTILRSTDNGLTWTQITSGVTVSLKSIHYANNLWVIVGDKGTILYSTDNGLTWVSVGTTVSNNLFAVYYGNGTWVTVGNGLIAISTSIESWNPPPSVEGSIGYLMDVFYGNGVWITIDTNNTEYILRSADNGLTWKRIPLPNVNSNGRPKSIYYANNLWVICIAGNVTLVSYDNGLSWTTILDMKVNYNIYSDNITTLSNLYSREISHSNLLNLNNTEYLSFELKNLNRTNTDFWEPISKILDYHNLNGFETRAIETLDGPQLEYRFPGNNEFGWSKNYFDQFGQNNYIWIATGSPSSIYRSTDNGLTWAQISISGISLSSVLSSIHYSNHTWIIAGTSGIILRSADDGLTWTKIATGVNTDLNAIWYVNHTWIAVGGSGIILRSADDGLTWTKIATGANSALYNIYHANHTWITTGSQGVILCSADDGLTWTKITSGVTTNLKGIYYANHIWIAVGYSGCTLRSTDDGLTWTQITLGGSPYLNNICYANSTWITVASGGAILRSTDDGLTWITITISGVKANLYGIYYANHTWIAVGYSGTILRSSDDGLTWTTIPLDGAPDLYSICNANQVYQDYPFPYKMAEFSDPNNLDRRYLAVPRDSSILLFNTESKNNNDVKEISLSEGGSNHIYSRNNDLVAIKHEMEYNDGLEWTQKSISFNVNTGISAIEYANNTWIAVGTSGTIFRSTNDGLTWTKISVSVPTLSSISYSNNTWIAVGASGTIVRSIDNGLNWTKITVDGVTSSLQDIYYANNTWIAVSQTGTIVRSIDNGLTWINIVNGVSQILQGISYSNNTWIIVGYNGTILRSTDDGLTWSKITVDGVTSSLQDIYYANNTWIATGTVSTILRSVDNGLTWSKMTIAGSTVTFYGARCANNVWIIAATGNNNTAAMAKSVAGINTKYTLAQYAQSELINGTPTPKLLTYNIPITSINIDGPQLEVFSYNYGVIPIQDNSYALFGYSIRVEENLWKTQYYIINIESQSVVWTNPNLICKTFIKPQSKFISCGGDIIMALDNDAAGLSTSQISYRIPLKYGDRTVLPPATTIGKYPEDHMYADAYVDHSPQCVYEKTYTSGNVDYTNRGKVPYDQKIVKIPGVENTTYTKDRYLIPKPYMANVIDDMKNPNEYDELP